MRFITRHKKNGAVLILITVALVVASWGKTAGQVGTLSAPAGDTSHHRETPIDELKESLLQFVLPVSGTIGDVENGHATIRFETERELRKGMRISVFRKGEPFYHPVTKEPIGQSESLVGRVEVVAVRDAPVEDSSQGSVYHCRVISGDPEAGDVVRITSSPVNIAFFQDKEADWALSEAFYTALKDSGRLQIRESYTESYDPRELSQVAQKLNADMVVLFSTPSRDTDMYVQAKLFWPEDARMFAELEEKVGPDVVKELAVLEDFMSPGAIEGEPWGRYTLEGGELIAMGDVNGNSERELVVSDGYSIRIYEYRQEPREVWDIKGNPRERHLSLDVLDVNGNGRAEIFVTYLIDDDFSPEISDGETQRRKGENRIRSFALEYSADEGYRRIWNSESLATRIMGSTLFMQKFNPRKTFTGPVYRGIWRDGAYQIQDALELPRHVDIYGFAFVDWKNSGEASVLSLDEGGYLKLYSKGELLWKSKKSYGGFNSTFERQSSSTSKSEDTWSVKGRLLTVKTEKGQEVLIIKKVPFITQLPGLGYRKTEVYSFWWDGAAMIETLVLGGIHGTVTDYWIEGKSLLLIARPVLFTFLKESLSGNIMRGSLLYYYNLAG